MILFHCSIKMFASKKHFLTSDERMELVSWKSVALLKTYTTRFAALKPRKFTGNSVRQQKLVRQAVLRARELGLVPYIK